MFQGGEDGPGGISGSGEGVDVMIPVRIEEIGPDQIPEPGS